MKQRTAKFCCPIAQRSADRNAEPSVITQYARAKINLTLRILGRRLDGYHELQSLTAFASDVFDVVTLDISKPPTVTMSGPFAPAVVGPNILALVLERLATLEPHLKLGALHVEKNLPVAAGIGGGSANAAAALRTFAHANQDLAATVDWFALAAELGADVPVCLLNRTAMMTGIGDKLTPLSDLPQLPAVLINPQAPVPADKTAQVFRTLNAAELSDGLQTPDFEEYADRDSLLAYLQSQGNDLAAPAAQVVPEIGDVLVALRSAPGCLYANLSGAGPTCFGIFKDQRSAAAAAQTFLAPHPNWWVKSTTLG